VKIKRIFPLLLLIFASLACQTLLPQTAPPTSTSTPQSTYSGIPLTEDQVPRISVEEAKAALDSESAILVDVRSVASYKNGHAAGAISIPLENFEFNVHKLSLEKSQWIITYCT